MSLYQPFLEVGTEEGERSGYPHENFFLQRALGVGIGRGGNMLTLKALFCNQTNFLQRYMKLSSEVKVPA